MGVQRRDLSISMLGLNSKTTKTVCARCIRYPSSCHIHTVTAITKFETVVRLVQNAAASSVSLSY